MSVITISRQFGAGGRTIGQKVAEKLGYTYINEDIIEKVALEANVSSDWIKDIEKESGSNWKRYFQKLGPMKSIFERPLKDKENYIDGFRYIELLHKVIPEMAKPGNVVIIGRGGQYILKDHPNAVHILMVAEFKDRVKFMMDHYSFNEAKADQVVRNMDKRRKNLYYYFNKSDYDNHANYTMTINMSKVSVDKAIELICKTAATK